MRFKNLDLIIAIVVVTLNIVWVQFPNRPLFIGVILVLPLVLFLPGYALTQALFRKGSASTESGQQSTYAKSSESIASSANPLKLGHPIGKADQLILSIGLSMALAILTGFLLNILPIGLQALSWAFSLGFMTILFALLAMLARRKNEIAVATRPRFRPTLSDMLFLGLALFIIVNAIWLAVIRPSGPQTSFTQFWMLPANPTNGDCVVSVGIQSFEANSTRYTLTVNANHQPITGNWSTITLSPQQKWVHAVPITPEAQNDLHIEALLYRADQPSTAYRNVHLTLHVSIRFQNGQEQLQCKL